MRITDAQRDVRLTFYGGAPGGIVTAILWLASSALATWGSQRQAIILLCVGGAFLFPATQLLLKAAGKPHALPAAHPMNALAMQVAFTVPFSMPVIGGAALYRVEWFYPAFMIVVGAHYLPFVFLSGMWHFAFLGGALIASGFLIGWLRIGSFALGGWVTVALMLGYAVVAWRVVQREVRSASSD